MPLKEPRLPAPPLSIQEKICSSLSLSLSSCDCLIVTIVVVVVVVVVVVSLRFSLYLLVIA